jgi:hypothetical protein
MDLVPEERTVPKVWTPESAEDGPEVVFLQKVARFFTQIGTLDCGREKKLREELSSTDFLMAE